MMARIYLLPMDRVTDISVRRYDQQITGKNGSMYVPITSYKQKNMWSKRIFIYPHGNLKRQYKVCNFLLKAEIRWSLKRKGRYAGLSSEGRDTLVTQADLSAPPVCVLQPSHYFTKRVPSTEEKHARTLSDCIPTTNNRRRRRIRI